MAIEKNNNEAPIEEQIMAEQELAAGADPSIVDTEIDIVEEGAPTTDQETEEFNFAENIAERLTDNELSED